LIINIGDDILKLQSLNLLKKLLADKTTKKNILWATDAYNGLGSAYFRNREIVQTLITGRNSDVIKTRARKAMEQQSERTRQHAEVFTPLWIVRKMNDYADETWFNRPDVFFSGDNPTDKVFTPQDKKMWQQYVDSRRLEITCGEAPYLVTRYDAYTGEYIPLKNRVGILDRKLRVVCENAKTEEEWLCWAFRALQATYGYEFQGDNVLIARVNILLTFEEYLIAHLKRRPVQEEYEKATNIITWNIWQMDGLTGTIPYCRAEESRQLSLFDIMQGESQTDHMQEQPYCRIYDWRGGGSVEFISLKNK